MPELLPLCFSLFFAVSIVLALLIAFRYTLQEPVKGALHDVGIEWVIKVNIAAGTAVEAFGAEDFVDARQLSVVLDTPHYVQGFEVVDWLRETLRFFLVGLSVEDEEGR